MADDPSIGVDLFNRGLYWEAHEAWEHEWVPDRKGPDAGFYKGLIQIAAGCLHYGRHNRRGAVNKWRSGAGYLRPYLPVHRRLRLVERVDRRRAGEQDELGAHRLRLAVGGCHRFRRARHLAHDEHLRAVPAELASDRRAEQLAGFRLQTLGGDDERAQRHEVEQLDDRTAVADDGFRLIEHAPGDRDRRDLAARDLFTLGDRLAVHDRE